MKKLWLVREPCTVLFDVKPIHEALGTEKMDSSVEVELEDQQYSAYVQACLLYEIWQSRLDKLIKQK
jgi:hypothetical protein